MNSMSKHRWTDRQTGDDWGVYRGWNECRLHPVWFKGKAFHLSTEQQSCI